jgi:hypothetical protein
MKEFDIHSKPIPSARLETSTWSFKKKNVLWKTDLREIIYFQEGSFQVWEIILGAYQDA